jgi:hypothetical protein
MSSNAFTFKTGDHVSHSIFKQNGVLHTYDSDTGRWDVYSGRSLTHWSELFLIPESPLETLARAHSEVA